MTKIQIGFSIILIIQPNSIMKTLYLLLVKFVLISMVLNAQNDTIPAENKVNEEQGAHESAQPQSKKKVNNIKIFAGISANKILLAENEYESAYSTGYLLGLAYRSGKYWYWEIGLNYNGQIVGFENVLYTQKTMEIRQVDMPVSVGLNILGETGRIVGLRVFGGLVPAYITGIKNNDFAITLDDLNRFQLAGHLGVGVDVLFLFVEAGYQYGFIDMIDGYGSKQSQFYFLLGFRF